DDSQGAAHYGAETDDHAPGRGLACAVWADEAEPVNVVEIDVDRVDRCEAGEALGHATGMDKRVCTGCWCGQCGVDRILEARPRASWSRSHCFTGRPPAKPVSVPSAPMTRCQRRSWKTGLAPVVAHSVRATGWW